MAKSKLIKDTTRAEREEIIKLALAGCGNGSCDNCGSCSLGAGDPYGTYQPYIDGEMEIADINMMVAERNAKLFSASSAANDLFLGRAPKKCAHLLRLTQGCQP